MLRKEGRKDSLRENLALISISSEVLLVPIFTEDETEAQRSRGIS